MNTQYYKTILAAYLTLALKSSLTSAERCEDDFPGPICDFFNFLGGSVIAIIIFVLLACTACCCCICICMRYCCCRHEINTKNYITVPNPPSSTAITMFTPDRHYATRPNSPPFYITKDNNTTEMPPPFANI